MTVLTDYYRMVTAPMWVIKGFSLAPTQKGQEAINLRKRYGLILDWATAKLQIYKNNRDECSALCHYSYGSQYRFRVIAPRHTTLQPSAICDSLNHNRTSISRSRLHCSRQFNFQVTRPEHKLTARGFHHRDM